jgi:hypothetical protein
MNNIKKATIRVVNLPTADWPIFFLIHLHSFAGVNTIIAPICSSRSTASGRPDAGISRSGSV